MAEHDMPDREVHRLLSLTADRVGPSTPPDPAGLVRRAARRDRARRTGAVAAVLVAVLAVVVPVGLVAAYRDATRPRPADAAAPSPLGTAAALAAGRWDNLPPAPIEGRSHSATAWTGSQLLVWGGGRAGQPGTSGYSVPLSDGASYDPATRAWQTMPAAPFSGNPASPVSAWTGDRWIVVSGRQAASYDPGNNSWRRLADVPFDGFVDARQAVWAGGQLIVQGNLDAVAYVPVLEAYSPATDSWRRLPAPPVGPGRGLVGVAITAQGEKVVAVASSVDARGVAPAATVSSLSLASGKWTEQIEASGSDRGPFGASTVVATPDALYIPASQRPCVPNASSCPYSVDPAARFVTGAWSVLPSATDNPVASGTATVWTGSALVALRDQAVPQVLDPTASRWIDLPTGPLPEAPDAVWAGDRLIVLASVQDPAGGYRLAGAALLPKPPAPGPAALPFTTLSVNGVQPTACGTDAPLSVYTATPGAETANTPEAAALRAILATGIAGQSFPPKHDWVEITRTADEVSYGHRTGAVGIGDFVSVKQTNGAWGFGGSAGCGPLGYGPTMADGIYRWAEQGSELVLSWGGGSCGFGSNGADASVQETATQVRVVLVPRPPAPSEKDVICAGVGTDESVRVALTAPVGDRKVINVGFVPARDVPNQPEIDAYQAHQSAEILRGQTACDTAASTLDPSGLKTSAAYPNDGDHPMTVGIIREALTNLPPGWADLPGDTPAAQCYLETPGTVQTRKIVSVVVAPGLPPYVYDRTHPVGGLFGRLGDPPG